jgi:hypothetical protein
MIFKIDGGKSVRVPMGWGSSGALNSFHVKIRIGDLYLFPVGTLFKQVNQHKEKDGSMCLVPEDIWLEVVKGGYFLTDEYVLRCNPVKINLEYLEKKAKQKEKNAK